MGKEDFDIDKSDECFGFECPEEPVHKVVMTTVRGTKIKNGFCEEHFKKAFPEKQANISDFSKEQEEVE